MWNVPKEQDKYKWHTFLLPPSGSVCVYPGLLAEGSHVHCSTRPCDLYTQPWWTRRRRAEKTPGWQRKRLILTRINCRAWMYFKTPAALTCPVVCMEQMVESEDRKPMASVLGYSPSSSTYMLSVKRAPSYATQLTDKDTHTHCCQ